MILSRFSQSVRQQNRSAMVLEFDADWLDVPG